MKPGDHVRINIPGNPFHGATGVITSQDDYGEESESVVFILVLDPAEQIRMNESRPIGVDETELEVL